MADAMAGGTSFKSKVVKSVGLSSAQFGVRFGLRLVSTVVLTRLLAPEVYGVFAIVLVYQYLLEMASDLGLRSLVITKEGETDDDFLRTCWTVSILRGAVIAGGTGVVALVIFALQAAGVFAPESAYSAPVLPWAIFALGGVSLLLSAQSINVFVSERNMAFGQVTLAIILSSVLGLVVTIGTALVWPTVWALVIGMVAQTLFQVVYSHLAFPGPKMGFRMEKQSRIMVIARGKWLMGHSILTAITQSADRLLLGVLMDSATFGLFFIASQVRDFCTGFLTMVHSSMGLQVFSHILQAPTETFRRNYYRYRLVFDAMACLGAGVLIMLAQHIVDLVFDPRYAGVADILRILALALVLTGPSLLRSAYSAERKFREMTYLSLLTATTLWLGLLLSVFVLGSMTGALLVIALHKLPEALALTIMGYRRDWVRIWRELLPLGLFAVGLGLGWGLGEIWDMAS